MHIVNRINVDGARPGGSMSHVSRLIRTRGLMGIRFKGRVVTFENTV
jgi:hypothetical protein